MTRIKLVIEYVGTAYHGWQKQPRRATVQGTLEDCIRRISGEKVSLNGAGRTDAGVHALGQVADFKTTARLDPETWRNALNAVLPRTISILSAQPVSDDFHSRRDAREKTYQYKILNRRAPSALLHGRAWHLPRRLRIPPMKKAAGCLIGEHDFTSFSARSAETSNRICRLKSLEIGRNGEVILLTFKGRRFLQYMVRNIVGTLVEVGLGKMKPGQMKEILDGRDRILAGPTAPPHGLFLLQIRFGKGE